MSSENENSDDGVLNQPIITNKIDEISPIPACIKNEVENIIQSVEKKKPNKPDPSISNIGILQSSTGNSESSEPYKQHDNVITQHGVFFQINVLLLYINRAVNKNYDFWLMTENPNARFFDGIIYRYKDDSGKLSSRFIQTKHTTEKIRKSELVNQSDFGITKFFLAFCKIKSQEFLTNINGLTEILTGIKEENGDSLCKDEMHNNEIELKEFTILTNTVLNDPDIGTKKSENFRNIKNVQNQLSDKWQIYLQEVDVQTTKSEEILEVNYIKKYVFKIPPADINEIINDEQLMLKTSLDKIIRELGDNIKKEDPESEDYKKLKNQITKLEKMSEDIEATVQEFFNMFNFVTNYSNREDLEQLIENKITDDFKLSAARFSHSAFYFAIEQWWVDRKEHIIGKKQGTEAAAIYFAVEHGKMLISDIFPAYNTPMALGKSDSYTEKLNNYRINFNENLWGMHTFLSEKDNKIMCIYSEVPRITAIKVFKTLESNEFQNHFDYLTKKGGCVFINLKDFLDVKNIIVNFFSSQQSLMVVECCPAVKEDNEMLNELQRYILDGLKHKNKKIVLIAKSDDSLLNKFTDSIKEIDDKINFVDIDWKNQNFILQNKIRLQGKETTLGMLLDKEVAKQIINHEILSTIIEKPCIDIGDNTIFSSSGYNPEYYIEKGFHVRKVRQDILKDLKSDGSLYITGIPKEGLIKFGISNNDIVQIKDDDDDRHRYHRHYDDKLPANWIIINPKSRYYSFHSLCWDDDKYVCHLQYKNGMFYYKECSLHENYDHQDSPVPEYLQMIYLNLNLGNIKLNNLDSRKKVVVLSGEAGSGKSTMMTRIAIKMKEQYPNLWISRINLNGLDTQKLKDTDFNESDTDGAISFISEMIIPENRAYFSFQRKMFAAGLKPRENESGDETYPKIVILFDGFDEIDEIQRRTILKLLKVLRNTNVIQIWITARPHEESNLETELECPIYKLYGLFRHEKITLLSRFFKWNLMFPNEDGHNQKCEKDFEKIMELLKTLQSSLNFFSTNDNSFTIRLKEKRKEMDDNSIQRLNQEVSKILEKYDDNYNDINMDELRNDLCALNFYGFSKWLIDNWFNKRRNVSVKTLEKVPLYLITIGKFFVEKKFQLPQKLDITELFSIIIKRNLDFYLQEKLGITEQDMTGEYQQEFQNLWILHYELALKEFELGYELQTLNNDKYKESEIVDMGLLTIKNNQLKFTHQCLAEYLVNDYICKNLQDERAKKNFVQILFKRKYEKIRLFLNLSLSRFNIENNLLFDESLTNEINMFMPKEKFPVFHFSTEEGLTEIIKFVLDNYKGEKIHLLLEADSDGETSLHTAADHGCLETFKVLLSTAVKEKVSLYDKFKKLIIASDRDGETILHHIASSDEPEFYVEAFEDLLKAVGDDKAYFRELIKSQNNDKQTFLLLGCNRDNVNTIIFLLNKIKETFINYDDNLLRKLIFQTEEGGISCVEASAIDGSFNIVKNLLSFIKNDFDESNYNTFRDSLFLTEDEYEMDKQLHLVILTGKTKFLEKNDDSIKQFKELKLILENYETGYTSLFFITTKEKMKQVKNIHDSDDFEEKIDFHDLWNNIVKFIFRGNQEICSLLRNWVDEHTLKKFKCEISFSNENTTHIDCAELGKILPKDVQKGRNQFYRRHGSSRRWISTDSDD